MREIRIAGAGPSGLAAAIVLARNGANVSVFEQNSCVGRRFNGDFQGIENWTSDDDFLERISSLGLETSFRYIPFHNFTFYDEVSRPTLVKSEQPIVYLIKRGKSSDTLDSGLLKQALAVGVQVKFNEKLSFGEADIIATGPQGKPDGIAKGITFDTNYPEFGCATLNQRLSPGGYTYFLSSGGSVTLATVLLRDFPRASECLRETIKEYEKLLGIKIPNKVRVWGGRGNFSTLSTGIRLGKLLVGEAAGFQDKLFGFGIRFALISGILAATSFIEIKNYDDLWKPEFMRLMKVSRANRFIFANFSISRQLCCQVLGKSKDPRRTLRTLYSWQRI
ncbi:MAG: hypothetical protein A3B86_00980 [Candidatus Yanofskybacteria bacterium RIFCSPHIGHO2_02_FULL_38_22b]|uniref:FAD/NAD(P)-binding domain-containing protein n=1 Tax=Candidatus Yanofskybacteria bacterium RIFCSPHIGHO2_02_FULL_38_22b TaxID=1802673 RepID=A0A1F8F2E5_9BACT|nr:MAG: hypothetical protein A3B86_00980 [Candidatus Yanofskybacteria bacterium RIFCSPHIGHO2_02_FULL_38_22b]OGN20367.1 MAG: hypothetical protein A2910_01330 [Candidatus Yanofskybacteria bacterium RIFCSPLOWO2_01_FULL_39_28]